MKTKPSETLTLVLRALTAIIFTQFIASTDVMATNSLHRAKLSTSDSIVVQKQLSSRKHKIRIYADANNEVIFFSADGEGGRSYQMFVFDVDGKLVRQANIKSKQTTVIDNVEKGTYLFEVFSDDERIENGQLRVL